MPTRLTRLTSRLLVYISMAELIAALYVVTTGLSLYHARLMFEAVLPTFIAGVAVAYVSSSLKGASRASRILEALASIMGWAVAATGLMASLGGPRVPLGVSLVVFGSLLASLTAYALRKWDIRLSVAMLGYTQALGGIVLLGAPWLGLFPLALVFVTVEAIGAIYSVTLHSFPSTFDDVPSKALTGLVFALMSAAVPAALLRDLWLSNVLLGASMLVSVLAFRGNRLRSYYAKARASPSPIARGGTLYFLYGHAFAFSALIVAGIVLIASAALRLGLLMLVHIVTLGAISLFVLIHAPMMLPVIMGWSSARRYNLTPYVSQAAAVVLWPFNTHVSFFFVGLAFVFDALIVLPSREPMPLSLVR
ncbi:MAG: hypothetical protein JHC13_00845 [Acidilobus sp.]|nr:hypothetical protein [Acidilobus sp.]